MTRDTALDTEAFRLVERNKELEAEVERLRSALELIAGSASNKLQAIQARAALDNIGAAHG